MLLTNTGINCVKLFGGVPHVDQIREMKPGAEIVIATPGRLIDYVKRGTIVLNYIQFLVLDEADRMLDMGFEKQLSEIVFLYQMPDKSKRQSLLFSATFSNEVCVSANNYIKDYLIASTNINLNDNSGNKNIEQHFIFCEENNKLSKIHEILQSVKGKVISK
jgi:ATP-dependent RNA helicase DDX3X